MQIISHKWHKNREKMSPVENFCSEMDPDFQTYNGKRIKLNYRIGKFLIKHSNSQSSDTYKAPYNSHFAGEELWGMIQIIKKRPNVVFFPYADYNYNYTWLLKRVFGFKIVLYTFFSEDELQKRFKNLQHFEQADLILVAGRGQLNYLQNILKNPTLKFFPLPLNTTFFHPGDTFIPFRIVQSGMNRRDFKTLFTALDLLYTMYPYMKVEFIGCSAIQNIYKDRPYALFYGFLSDEEMLKVYQRAHLQLLIAKDGGSSNSLSEGLACGLPMIVTRLNNLTDYINDQCCMFVEEGDFEQIVNCVSEIFGDDTLRKQMAEASRRQALNYSVNKLIKEFQIYIEELQKGSA